MTYRSRIVAAMASLLWHYAWIDAGHVTPPPTPPPVEAFRYAEELARAIEIRNREGLSDLFALSLDLDHRTGVRTDPMFSTPEHFGTCLASMSVGTDEYLWWDNHHDFELVVPHVPGYDLMAIATMKEAG